jgi:hypothetical protein
MKYNLMNINTEIHSFMLSDEHTLQVFQTEVLRMSGPRRDEALYDLVTREGLWNTITTFVILMKLPTDELKCGKRNPQ